MDPRSARALLSLSFLLLFLIAGTVGNPAAGAVVSGLAALSALPAVVFGKRWLRAAGVLVLAASLAATAVLLPPAIRHMDAYRDRALRAPQAR
jgi:hypothetical protein